jgi:ribosomal protein S18 acetylase RimI-like enzyme
MSSLPRKAPGIIRPYDPSDRPGLFRIAADTAFFGEPLERYMEDRRLFNDAFYAYYTDAEPACCWIAEADRQVVGFLTGCLNSKAQAGRYIRLVLPGLLTALARGKYSFGPLTTKYIRKLVGAALRGEIPRVDTRIYPAHLHINVDVAYRRRGLGNKLMNSYLAQLRSLRIPGVHLETTSLNEAACRLYERLGFRVVSAHSTRMWSWIVEGPVELRCYGLRLTNAQ